MIDGVARANAERPALDLCSPEGPSRVKPKRARLLRGA